jgi:hypothetical protein
VVKHTPDSPFSLYLADQSGAFSQSFEVSQGAGTVLQNSQCSVYDSGTSDTYPLEPSGPNNLIFTPLVSFTAAYTGLQPVYAQAFNMANQSSGWIEVGTVCVGTSSACGTGSGLSPGALTNVVTTVPAGLPLLVDGGLANYGLPCTSPCSFVWAPGSTHTIAPTAAVQTISGAQYTFSSWNLPGASNTGSAFAPTITAPSGTGETYTATFAVQYYLTTSVYPAGAGTVTGSGLYPAGTVQVAATPNSGYAFDSFSGALSGTSSLGSFTLSGNTSLTANFGTATSGVTLRMNGSGYGILNNGVQAPWTYCLSKTATSCVDGGFDSQNISSCEVGGGNGNVTVGTIVRDVGGIRYLFSVPFTANRFASGGPRSLICTYSGQKLVTLNALTVYDATPSITSAQPSQPSSPGGPFSVTLTGTNFGPTTGTVTVCTHVGGDFPPPCTSTGDIAVTQPAAAWNDGTLTSPGSITVTLTPTAAASGTYDIAITSLGESGTGFMAEAGVSESQSNRASVQVTGTLTLSVTSNGTQIVPLNGGGPGGGSQSSCANIGTAPNMPQLSATIQQNGGGPPANGTATWQLVTTFTRTTKVPGTPIPGATPNCGNSWVCGTSTDTNSVGSSYLLSTTAASPPVVGPFLPPTLAPAQSQAANLTWTPSWPTGTPPPIFGGNASINWTYNGTAQAPFNFYICGANPAFDPIQTYITNNIPNYWFAWNIALHETNASQFCDGAANRQVTPNYCSQTSNWDWPVFGPPAGYGIMQVDPVTTQDPLWNWQTAVTAGGSVISAHAASAYPLWSNQVAAWVADNANQTGHNLPTLPAPSQQEGGGACNFQLAQDSTGAATPNVGGPPNYWFGDAILMKQYNGLYDPVWARDASGSPILDPNTGRHMYVGDINRPRPIDNYITWHPSNLVTGQFGYWQLRKATSSSANYIDELCSCVVTGPTSSACNDLGNRPQFLPYVSAVAISAGATPNSAQVTSGTTTTLTVTLIGMPPAGGATVALTVTNLSGSGTTAFPVPATLTIPAGSASASVNVVAGTVTAPTYFQVYATYYGSTAADNVLINPQQ